MGELMYASISLNEEDTKLKLITPAVQKAGWNTQSQIFCEYSYTDGEIIVRGKVTTRGRRKKVDYLLMYQRDLPLAIIEAKDTQHAVGAGMQQGIGYASDLRVPFVYSSNGKGFLEHDMATGTERQISMDEFPSPEDLWQRYAKSEGYDERGTAVATAPYYHEYESMSPRYYQRNAINETMKAIAHGKNRVLLVMATGTGKTFTAFQMVHRLRESGLVKKVLYLADRNVLVDQTITGDFKPLDKVTTKVQGRKLDSAYEVYFSLYQQLVGEDGEEIFRAFDPSFFDLIIVDECHRGSAREDSAWRKILEYFSGAIQIGMTATPKETKDVSNIDYFGDPVYTYSLKQGIKDGFLAPYKVIRPKFDVDIYGFRPGQGQLDDQGLPIEDRVYEMNDFDRTMVIKERTELVARKVTQFLKETDRFSKTIVFCVDIDHAERMRQALVNENADLCAIDPRYVMRITGDEAEGKAQLDNFMDPDEKYPCVVTTSKLLTTGVNCKTCRVIVLDNVFGEQGMTEFKQIIGRGTRVCEPYGKLYFNVIAFRHASRLFADTNFAGYPVCIYEPGDDSPMNPDDPGVPEVPAGEEPPVIVDPPVNPGAVKYYVHGISVRIASERVEYFDSNGGLVTESLRDYSKRSILGEYEDLDHFLVAWNSEKRKRAIIDELNEAGAFLDELREASGQYDLSDFDLICHIAYDQKPLTRSERARNVQKKGYHAQYGDVARSVLDALLDKYSSSNLIDLTDTRILDLEEFRQFGSPMKIVKAFGGKQQYIEAVAELERELYTA